MHNKGSRDRPVASIREVTRAPSPWTTSLILPSNIDSLTTYVEIIKFAHHFAASWRNLLKFSTGVIPYSAEAFQMRRFDLF